jgi:hypothetical protein
MGSNPGGAIPTLAMSISLDSDSDAHTHAWIARRIRLIYPMHPCLLLSLSYGATARMYVHREENDEEQRLEVEGRADCGGLQEHRYMRSVVSQVG